MWYFSYSAFRLTGQWGAAIALPGYATGTTGDDSAGLRLSSATHP